MGKRGISAIVATVLIILVTVAAVTIIWAAIIPMIQDRLDVVDADVQFSVVSFGGFTAYDSTTRMLMVQVRRGVDEAEINEIKIIIKFEGGNSIFKIVDAPAPNQMKTYEYQLGGVDVPISVSVAPIVIENSGEKEGIASSDVDFDEGSIDKKDVEFFDEGSFVGTSCLNILENYPSSENGMYEIDPDDSGSFEVYCDMETDGGGWTLIMKTKDNTQEFHYDSEYWTTLNMFQENDVTINVNDVKYDSFNKVSFSSLRGCVSSAITNCLIHDFSSTKVSALSLFSEVEGPTCTKFDNGGTLTFADFENVFGFELYAGGNCDGGPVFNKPDASCGGGVSKVRWGVYNDEDVNCGSPNEAMGWGLTNDGTAPGSAGSGGYSGRMIHQGKNTWLWVK